MKVEGMPRTNAAPDFESVTQALSSPARRAILAHVDGEWMTITELARARYLAVSTTSHHVHVLRWAGLVLVERSGREAHVTAKYRDHEIVIQRRPARYPVPVRVHADGGGGDGDDADAGSSEPTFRCPRYPDACYPARQVRDTWPVCTCSAPHRCGGTQLRPTQVARPGG